jgi:hypothetical protein
MHDEMQRQYSVKKLTITTNNEKREKQELI